MLRDFVVQLTRCWSAELTAQWDVRGSQVRQSRQRGALTSEDPSQSQTTARGSHKMCTEPVHRIRESAQVQVPVSSQQRGEAILPPPHSPEHAASTSPPPGCSGASEEEGTAEAAKISNWMASGENS